MLASAATGPCQVVARLFTRDVETQVFFTYLGGIAQGPLAVQGVAVAQESSVLFELVVVCSAPLPMVQFTLDNVRVLPIS